MLRASKAAVKSEKRPVDLERFAAWTALLVGIALATLGMAAAVMSAVSSSEIHHCYVKTWGDTTCGTHIVLMGEIDWGEDKHISDHASVTDAVRAAEQLHCPLLRKP